MRVLAASVQRVATIAVCGLALTRAAADDGRVLSLLGGALGGSRAQAKLAHLSDRIGHRLSGSPALELAVRYTAEQLRRDGVPHVWTERVLVPHWERGTEAGRIVAPVERRLAMLTLGGSVGTPPGGVEAEVLVVDSLDQLDAAGEAARGKIVLFDKAIGAGFDANPGYGTVAPLRTKGPSAAARRGSVATMIRSLGTADFRLPHTGALKYEDDAPQIPAVAIAAEDAMLIRRLIEAGDAVRVRLELGARTLPDAESANVLAEIRGRERPQEIVLLGAHLDSWDVGQGALDDGAGCAIVMETMRLLARLDPAPRRTVRAVLFTNEENGLRGGKDYALRHGDELHVAAIESDSGGAAPTGFGVTAGAGGVELVTELAAPLRAVGATRIVAGGGGADISPLRERGVPVLSLIQDTTHYFDYHHTEADTLDKVQPADLDRNVAALAVLAYGLAEQEATLAPVDPADRKPAN